MRGLKGRSVVGFGLVLQGLYAEPKTPALNRKPQNLKLYNYVQIIWAIAGMKAGLTEKPMADPSYEQ